MMLDRRALLAALASTATAAVVGGIDAAWATPTAELPMQACVQRAALDPEGLKTGPWRGKRGVNVTAPFVVGSATGKQGYYPKAYTFHRDLFYQLKTWTEFKSVGHLAKIKDAGFDHVRFILDPGPLVLARGNGDSAAYVAYKDEILAAVQDYIDHELGVMLTFALQRDDQAPVNWHNTIGNGLANPMYRAYRDTAADIAATIVDNWPTGLVCFEPYNEPAPARDHDINWVIRCEDMHRAIRAAAGADLTIVWGPDGWYDKARLSQFNTAKFDERTGWAFHSYDPRTFAFQGYPWSMSQSSNHFIRDLEFPPRRERWKSNLAEAVARIDASTKLNAGQKSQFKASLTSDLRAYYEAHRTLHG